MVAVARAARADVVGACVGMAARCTVTAQPFDHDDAATLAVIYELLLSGGDDEYDAPGATADAWAGPLAPPCPPCVPRNRAERRALRRRR